MTARDTLVEELVAAWVQWSTGTAHEPRAEALVRATSAVAGDKALELRRHIEAEMRSIAEARSDKRQRRSDHGTAPAPRDVRRAIYEWLNADQQGAVA